jgi:hypothetical protein
MNVAEIIEKIKSIDRDIESIRWAQKQINLSPVNSKVLDVLGNEPKRLEKEKGLIMGFYVEDNPPKVCRGGGEG